MVLQYELFIIKQILRVDFKDVKAVNAFVKGADLKINVRCECFVPSFF